MKKARLVTLFTILMTVSLLLAVGCQREDKISSIALKDHDPNSAIEILAGGFDYDAYTLVVSYDSGITEEITLTEDMIVAEDLFKFYREGESDVTISYGGQQYVFRISVKRSSFASLRFPENNVFTYSGEAYTVEVEGDLPANAVVTYPGGNSFVNVGTYDVTAIVSCDGYVTERLSTTVQIKQAQYDVSGITFDSKTVVYDGMQHTLAISGTLPEGVAAPMYYLGSNPWAGAKAAGEYKVVAVFANSDANYEPIPSMEATLTIEKATHDVGEIRFAITDRAGESLGLNVKLYDGEPMIVSISPDTWLPKGTVVSYSLLKDNAEATDVNAKGPVSLTEAGTYTVTVSFTLPDEANYEPIASASTTVEIHKAPYSLGEDIYMESDVFIYDGTARSLKLRGAVPDYVNVSYEYYLDGALQVDDEGNPLGEVASVGRYTVKAVFTHSNVNYADAEPISAELEIIEAQIDMSSVGFSTGNTVVYDGEYHSLTLVGLETLPDFVKVCYQYYRRVPCAHKEPDSNGAEVYRHMFDEVLLVDENGEMVTAVRDAAEYAVKVIFTVEDPNYADVGNISASFIIKKATVDLRDLTMVGAGSYTYDGQAHGWELQNISDLIRVEKALYSVDGNGKRTPVDAAVNAGNYVTVFEFVLVDGENYLFDEDFMTTQEEMFSIIPCEISISDVALAEPSLTYNGTNQYPTLTGVPAYFEATVTVYPPVGNQPITEVIDAGNYRVEIVLTVKDANYRPSADKLERSFEIRPIEIDVGGLEFDSLTFTYDQNPHLPQLVALPDHVKMGSNLYFINSLYDEEYVEEATKAGTYRYEVWLTPESANYTLVGQTRYDVEFEIKVDRTVIADLDALLEQEYVEIPYDEGYGDGYDYAEDEEALAQAILNAIFGENAALATCQVGVRYPQDLDGNWVQSPTPLLQDTVYVISNLQVMIKPESDGTYKYCFAYMDSYVIGANAITIRVKLV